MPMPLAVGREQGWPLRVWTCLAIAVLATPVLLAWQRAVGRRGGEPIINTRLFANLSYTLLLTAYSVFQLLPRCFMFTVSRLLQTGLGKSADRASVVFVCPRRALQRDLAARRPPGHARHGSRIPVSGAALVIAGLIALAAELTLDSPSSSSPPPLAGGQERVATARISRRCRPTAMLTMARCNRRTARPPCSERVR
jgi:hypothetical protein